MTERCRHVIGETGKSQSDHKPRRGVFGLGLHNYSFEQFDKLFSPISRKVQHRTNKTG
jgi:hypothetical protein